MAEMLRSALVQEGVSRCISFVLGKREEKSSQGHLTERLEMAVSELELALERSAKLPITDVSLLQRRKMIKRAYVEAMELLGKHKQQAVPAAAQEQMVQGVKRKRWAVSAKNLFKQPSAAMNTHDVGRFEWFADRASKFLRDVESGRSLCHYTFCNPIVRHLLEGKTLSYSVEQGNRLRSFYIWPTCSEERGVEAVLECRYEDSAMPEKCFYLLLVLRLSERVDIVQVATKGLQYLTSQFKLAAESAMGKLTLLPDLQDIAHSYVPPWVDNKARERRIKVTQHCRPDPACCRANRQGLCAENSISYGLADVFPEQVIFLGLHCYTSALEHTSCTSRGRSSSPMVAVTVGFIPHCGDERLQLQDSYAIVTMGNAKEYRRDASIEQVAETLKSDAVNCFLRQPDLTKYEVDCYSKHGGASFVVEKLEIQRESASSSCASTKRNMAAPIFLTCRWVLQLAHDRPR